MTIRVNDLDVLWSQDGLYYEVELARLSNSENSVRLAKRAMPVLDPADPRFDVTVEHLAETTVYRARLRFFKHAAPGSSSWVQVGDASDWYYTTTTGPEDKSIVRTAMVLKGFKEYGDSELGLVGYRGREDVDGTRYGADRDERWCSEFYSWVARSYLEDMRGNDTVDDLVDYFDDYDAYYGRGEIPERARRGDYVAMGTKDDGKKSHSGMFLAYDAHTGTVWTLEGNAGNRVKVMARALDEVFKGLGYITHAMLR